MAVYVDPLFNTDGWSDNWPFKQACHCWADSVPELMEFCVRKLGMRRAWFQDKKYFPHFDLTAAKRTQAIKLGAIEADDEAAVRHRRFLRELEQRDKAKFNVYYKGEFVGQLKSLQVESLELPRNKQPSNKQKKLPPLPDSGDC